MTQPQKGDLAQDPDGNWEGHVLDVFQHNGETWVCVGWEALNGLFEFPAACTNYKAKGA